MTTELKQTVDEPKKEVSKMIIVPEDLITQLTDRISRLERGEAVVMDDTAERKKIATMRVWDKKLVVGWERPYLIKDPTKDAEENLMFEIHLKNKDQIEKVVVNYLTFLREAEKVEVEIQQITREDKIETQGFTTVKEVDDYRTVDTGIRVPVKITIPRYKAVVKLPSGHEITVDANYLNA